jgi:hypothetical protein
MYVENDYWRNVEQIPLDFFKPLGWELTFLIGSFLFSLASF